MQKGTQQHGRQQLVKQSKIGKKQLARQFAPPPTAIVVTQVDGLRILLISVKTIWPQYGHWMRVGSTLGICLSLILYSSDLTEKNNSFYFRIKTDQSFAMRT